MTVLQALDFTTALLPALVKSKQLMTSKGWNAVEFFQSAIKKNPGKEFLVYVDDDRSMTYAEFDEISDRIAKWAQNVLDVGPGSCVSLVKANSIEFILVWYSMAKLGAKTALINHTLSGFPLANCLKLAANSNSPASGEKRNVVIYGSDSQERLSDDEVLSSLEESGSFEFWLYNGGGNIEKPPDGLGHGHTWQSMDESLETVDSALTTQEGAALREGIKGTDIFLYIYTSGTTGLPKAAKISHGRFAAAGQ